MNRSRRLLSLALIGLLAACTSTADASGEASTATVSPAPSTTAEPSTLETPEPVDSHDMGDMDGSGETASVEISNFAFVPAQLTIAAGTEVTFTNVDPAPHTVTAGSDDEPMPELFDSGLLEQDESFTFVFDEPGTYAYFCDRHPPMEASITVEG